MKEAVYRVYLYVPGYGDIEVGYTHSEEWAEAFVKTHTPSTDGEYRYKKLELLSSEFTEEL